jgi:hypothetical protein
MQRVAIRKSSRRQSVKKPFKFDYDPNYKYREVNRHVLMRGLLEEIEQENSLCKLYASLLAVSMLVSDPKLRRKFEQKVRRATNLGGIGRETDERGWIGHEIEHR